MVQVSALSRDTLIGSRKNGESILCRLSSLGSEFGKSAAEFVGHIREITTGSTITSAELSVFRGLPQSFDERAHISSSHLKSV